MTNLSPLVLYCLKRDFGAPIDIYHLASSSVDLQTGTKTSVATGYHVNRAVVMPARMSRSKVIVRTANTEFLNLVDFGTREFIVSCKDAIGLTPATDDWIVYDGKKYQIATIEEFECGGGWVFSGKEISGEIPRQVLATRVTAASVSLNTAVTQ
jgi:hypothetical protein